MPLHGEKLKGLQDTSNNVGIRVIDEKKSMVGQTKITMVRKSLQEALIHYNDQPFGNISVVLLGDFNQLPPVCDSPLFKANGINPSGYNLCLIFDKSITFTELVRQQGADQAGSMAQLARMGEGVFMEADWRSCRGIYLNMLPASEKVAFLDNAIIACAKKKT